MVVRNPAHFLCFYFVFKKNCCIFAPMDNRIFDINGRTKEQLKLAVKCLLYSEYDKEHNVSGWYFRRKKGLVLCAWKSNENGYKSFTDRMGNDKPANGEELVEILWEWLQSDEAKTVEFKDWEIDLEHDGSNNMGWRLYTEEWGHVQYEHGHTIDHATIAAFKPMYLWYGK